VQTNYLLVFNIVLWICDENTENKILKILDNLETK